MAAGSEEHEAASFEEDKDMGEEGNRMGEEVGGDGMTRTWDGFRFCPVGPPPTIEHGVATGAGLLGVLK